MQPIPAVTERFNQLQKIIPEIIETPSRDYVDIADFYEWATSVLSLLERVFGVDSIHYKTFAASHEDFRREANIYHFNICRGTFYAARADYNGGFLFKADSLLSAAIFDDVLDQATHLLENGFDVAACVVAGVALESTIKKLCDKQTPKIPHGKLSKMNEDLHKASAYNLSMQKFVTAWTDLRNNAAHGNGSLNSSAQIKLMIEGVRHFMATHV